ncbi:hypothetical protein NDU88_005921 [Pleurodeles waltl]|uniref:Uncharacterized protein n=1 Tax=Pleurodeles waltl TaxID=8319 RepID=A0AAV7L2A0_PLEWA|nr:hypothetical protein NDU88_005921 [Pleurodeles waltl]
MGYALLFPTTLRVVDTDTTRFFTTPGQAGSGCVLRELQTHEDIRGQHVAWSEGGSDVGNGEAPRNRRRESVSLHGTNRFQVLSHGTDQDSFADSPDPRSTEEGSTVGSAK